MDRARLADTLENQKSYFAKLIVYEQWREQPWLYKVYGESGYEKSHRDTEYHISYLSQAIAVEDSRIFLDYIEWVKILFHGLGLSLDGLKENLVLMRDFLSGYFETEGVTLIKEYLALGIQQLERPLRETSSYFDNQKPLSALARQYLNSLLRGERLEALQLVRKAIADRTSIRDLHLLVFQPCQYEVGRLWHENQISVAQEHYCTASTQWIMAQLYPMMSKTPSNGYRVVAACVGNEFHEVGLRMVTDFFEMEGWDTYYLGANTPSEAIVKMLETTQADILAVSATLPTHIRSVQELIALVRRSKSKVRPKILVGGLPFNQYPQLCSKLGADGYAQNADQAVAVATKLINPN